MTLDEIRQFVNFRLKKDYFGNALKPDDFNNVIKFVNIEYFCQKFGLTAEYQKGSAVARINFEDTLKITDDMRLFISNGKNNNGAPFIINSAGFTDLPEDYLHRTSILYDYQTDPMQQVPVELLTNAQWNTRLGRSIRKPTKKNPVANIIGSKIRFSPTDLKVVHIEYLRKPKEPFYATNEDINTQSLVYDPDNSVQFEWPEDCHADLANMILSYAADNLMNPQAKQSAELRKAKGV